MGTARSKFRIAALFLIFFGALATYAMWQTVQLAVLQSSWVRTYCTIDSSELKSDEYGTDSLVLNYHYVVGGQTLHSSQYELKSNVSHSEVFYRSELERLVPGVDVACYYDPAVPSNAVISKVGWGDAAFILIPGLFLLIGIGLLVPWRSADNAPSFTNQLPERSTENLTEESERTISWARLIFFLLFIVVGVGITYLIFGIPYLELNQARSWSTAQCTIQESRVAASVTRDSKNKSSTSYSLEVRYDYSFGDRRYIGQSYNLGAEKFLSRDQMNEVVNTFAQGSTVPCYVNPVDPTHSTLSRDVPAKIYLGLLPLLLTFAGFLGLIVTRSEKQSSESGFQILGIRRKAASRLGSFVTYIIATLIWNGITAAVVISICFDSDGSVSNYFALVIAAPFVVIGLALLIGIPYSFLQIFNPTLDLILPAENIRLGKTFSIGWRLNGSSSRIKELRIEIKPDIEAARMTADAVRDANEGEVVTYTVEESKLTSLADSKSIYKEFQKILQSEFVKPFTTTNIQMITQGRAEFVIPTAEKLEALGIKSPVLRWKIMASLKIPFYPDSTEICQVEVVDDGVVNESDEDEVE